MGDMLKAAAGKMERDVCVFFKVRRKQGGAEEGIAAHRLCSIKSKYAGDSGSKRWKYVVKSHLYITHNIHANVASLSLTRDEQPAELSRPKGATQLSHGEGNKEQPILGRKARKILSNS